MKETRAGDREVEALTADERKRIRDAMMFRFGAYLRPGEDISVEAEKGDEYVYSKLLLESANEGSELELEAAILAADQGGREFGSPQEVLDIAFDFLKIRMLEHFQSDRRERFHVDWRHHEVEGLQIRFRGRLRKPELEERADELLEEYEEGEGGT